MPSPPDGFLELLGAARTLRRLGVTNDQDIGRALAAWRYGLSQHEIHLLELIAGVHMEFASFLDGITLKPHVIEEVAARILTEAVKSMSDMTAHRKQHVQRAAQLETELRGLIRMRAQGLITDDEFLEQKRVLIGQRAAMESTPSRFDSLDQVKSDLKAILPPLSSIQKTWRALQPSFQKRFQRLIRPAGFSIGRIGTADLGLLFSTFRTFPTTESALVPLTGFEPVFLP